MPCTPAGIPLRSIPAGDGRVLMVAGAGSVNRGNVARWSWEARRKGEAIIEKVPFFGNPDQTHCFQAVIRMLLKYQFPVLEYSWSDLDTLTGKKEGLWTWPLYAMLQLHDMGFEIINMEDFDYHRFIQEGPTYLKEKYGEEAGTAQIEHSDILYEMKNAALFLQRLDYSPHLPGLDDFGNLISLGFLLICNVNSCVLNGTDGYLGHFILVYGVDDTSVFAHDPGPPHRESRIVPHNLFLKAWAFPSEAEKNLMAFRHKRHPKPNTSHL